ncbi:SPC24 protein, partial [Rhinopomastus cyanomelas]|nr:SPC24 protein [Rhinopomastus cyanomelas]
SYVTQLYYKISRIDWDYEAEPGQIRGSECPLPPRSPLTPPTPLYNPLLSLPPQVHYGPAIAQPIAIDSSRHSRCFLSDYLWSLVPTAW